MNQRHAWLSIVLGLSCVLAGCDKLTYGRVVIESPGNVDPACIDGAAQYVDATLKFARVTEQQGSVEFEVARATGVVGIHVYRGSTTLSFGWLGKEPQEVEKASLRLLDDVRRAVIRSCDIQQPPAKITRTCAFRGCDEWLKAE